MAYPELFPWWAMTISWGIVFLVVVSIYLYMGSRKRRNSKKVGEDVLKLMRDFVFVWVLVGLLVLYIVSIDQGSSIMFAAGNVLVELFLLAYILRNRTERSDS